MHRDQVPHFLAQGFDVFVHAAPYGNRGEIVIPAQAGIQGFLDSRPHGNDIRVWQTAPP
ncbi:hypothetical protein GCM10028813_03160 [Ramlibacter alkalitolerans]